MRQRYNIYTGDIYIDKKADTDKYRSYSYSRQG